jgi:nucleotide-binding universal stress UspA family protein
MFRNILVAIDPSPSASRALQHAVELAEALKARLTVMAVVPPVPVAAYGAPVDVGALKRGSEHATEQVLHHAIESIPDTVVVEHVLKHGDPSEEIFDRIREAGHDLVVIGSRGRGRVRANLLGSVGADLLYHSTIPMLIVHEDHADDVS